MKTAVDMLRHVGLATFIGLTIACVRQWRTRSSPAIRWATAAFGSMAAIGLVGLVLQQPATRGVAGWLIKGLLVDLILFPYFLYRFATAFQPPRRATVLTARFVTLAGVILTLALPRLPTPLEPPPAWFTGYRIAILLQWTVLFSIVAAQLWSAANAHANVSRQRMRTLALAAVGMNVAILLSGVAPAPRSQAIHLVTQLLFLASSGLFFIGLAPPGWLLTIWRSPEQRRFQSALRDILRATTQAEVGEMLLPHVVGVIGARGAALVSPSGALLARHGSTDTPAEIARIAARPADNAGHVVNTVHFRTGSLVIWTSPYAPFFSRDELAMMDAWGVFVDIAIERCTVADRQRTFIGNAAHELRTPLTTILGVASTLAHHRRSLSAPQVKECIDALERQGTRAVALIGNLLDLAQLDSGRHATSIEPVPLAVAAKRALAAAPPPDGITVEVNVDDHAVAAADPDRLEQVVVNLLVNAYRYGGSDIRIETRDERNGVVLTVSDAGSGVPQDLIPHLFEPFARASGVKSPGSGLGLALSKRLAEAMAGTLSYSPGTPHGARFNLRLRRSA